MDQNILATFPFHVCSMNHKLIQLEIIINSIKKHFVFRTFHLTPKVCNTLSDGLSNEHKDVAVT